MHYPAFSPTDILVVPYWNTSFWHKEFSLKEQIAETDKETCLKVEVKVTVLLCVI